jgi:hypothetical protein
MPSYLDPANLQSFQKELMGVWSNDGVPTADNGGPLSYNIMPLPQLSPSNTDAVAFHGYILKNFAYTETSTFGRETAQAPNRGGQGTQIVDALFYEQVVAFAEGPGSTPKPPGNTVHVENGAWLYLQGDYQDIGPYKSSPRHYENFPIPRQDPMTMIAKQAAVPHGNSILAIGHLDGEADGAPDIADATPPYPTCGSLQVPHQRFDTKLAANTPVGFENPNPDWAKNPNLPVRLAIEAIKPDSYVHWYVSTERLKQRGLQDGVTNILFEQHLSNVARYDADYWLLRKGSDKYLAYVQTMYMSIDLLNQNVCQFQHITCNTIKWQRNI